MSVVTIPFAWLLLKFYDLTGNYGAAVILFALIVNIILSPFMAKTKKSSMRMAKLTPLMQDLERRHKGNPQKYQEEVSKLYRENKINPMSGCIWNLIPFPILLALYSVIRQPLSRMMQLSSEKVTLISDWLTQNAGFVASKNGTYDEITMANLAHQNFAQITTDLGDQVSGLLNIDYSFLGLNLGNQPQWNFFTKVDWSVASDWGPALVLFLIPFISAGISYLSMVVSMKTNPSGTAQQQASMKSMMIFMPLVSVWICFIMPAALGVYWIFSSLFGLIRDVLLTKLYKKQVDAEDAERRQRMQQREAEMERKRQESERKRQEGAMQQNENTSKKKLQAAQKQRDEERKAAAERAEKAARRKGQPEDAPLPSQVGKRLFARGRAYDPDRYPNPNELGEETEAEAEAPIPELPDEPEAVQPDEVETAEVQSDEAVAGEMQSDEAETAETQSEEPLTDEAAQTEETEEVESSDSEKSE